MYKKDSAGISFQSPPPHLNKHTSDIRQTNMNNAKGGESMACASKTYFLYFVIKLWTEIQFSGSRGCKLSSICVYWQKCTAQRALFGLLFLYSIQYYWFWLGDNEVTLVFLPCPPKLFERSQKLYPSTSTYLNLGQELSSLSREVCTSFLLQIFRGNAEVIQGRLTGKILPVFIQSDI